MSMKRRTLFSSVTALAGLAAPGIRAARAQSWPSRPIELVVGWAAGSGTDVLARTLAPFMERYLGNGARIGVVNRPGAGGEVGLTAVATARPDGYTIGTTASPSFMMMMRERQTRFTFDSFDFIGNVVSEWQSIFVAANSPFQTLQDLVDYAKANPRRLNIGMQGGPATAIAINRFSRAAGIEMTMVPFPGGGPNRTALMGGHIQVSLIGLGDGAPFVREGQIRILGAMAPSRWVELPDAPTMREQGIDVIARADRGLAAPAGTPAAVMEQLSDALTSSLNDPDFVASARTRGLVLNPMPRAEYQAHLAEMNQEIGELWRTEPWRR